MIALELIGGLFAFLLIAAVLFATGLWVLLPVLVVGLLIWSGSVIRSAVH